MGGRGGVDEGLRRYHNVQNVKIDRRATKLPPISTLMVSSHPPENTIAVQPVTTTLCFDALMALELLSRGPHNRACTYKAGAPGLGPDRGVPADHPVSHSWKGRSEPTSRSSKPAVP